MTCTPDSSDGDTADNCVTAVAPASIGGDEYGGVVVECYCPTIDCQLDVLGNGEVDCLTPEGTVCNTEADGIGYALSCGVYVSTEISPYTFTMPNGAPLQAPLTELDNDADGYVECTEFDQQTYRLGGGSFSVKGGSDCDDIAAFVYPGAAEYCDGRYNDCSSLTYSATGMPSNESDVDGDGYVECTPTNGVPWSGDVEPTGYTDCVDTDGTVYPSASELCDGQYNNCDDPDYALNAAPANESDIDGDGYIECDNDGSEWKGAEPPTGYSDCADSVSTIFPNSRRDL